MVVEEMNSCSVTTTSSRKRDGSLRPIHDVPTLLGANRARCDRDVERCPQEMREAIEEALWDLALRCDLMKERAGMTVETAFTVTGCV